MNGVTISLLVTVLALPATNAIDCYICDHHSHHNHHETNTCHFTSCYSGQYCRLQIDKHHAVKGDCHDLYHHGHDLNHCLHDMKHWCHDYRLSAFHGECIFCCSTSDCVRQALGLQGQTTTAPPTTAAVSRTAAPLITAVPTGTSSCQTDCVDIFPDCAKALDVCKLQFGPLVCKKFCGLCSSNNKATTTAAAVLPLCTDHVKNHNCHLIPNVCSDPLAKDICPEFCGYCRGTSTTPSLLTQSPSTSTTASPSACTDHSDICIQQAGICGNPLATQLCPKTCNACSSASHSTPSLPSQAPSTSVAASTTPSLLTHSPSTSKTAPTTTVPAITSTASTTPASTAPASTVPASTAHHAPHRTCYQCGNFAKNDPCTLAEVALGTPTPCQTGAYCMTDVYNTPDGRMQIIKRCVRQQECRRKWYDETSDRGVCVSYDSLNRVPDLACHFCCTKDNCNTNIVPDDLTLYTP